MWKEILAAALLCLAAGSYAQPVEQNASGQSGATNSNQRPPENPAVLKSLSGISRSLEAHASDPKAEEDRQRARDDLKAQQDMARWTLVMAAVSVGALVLSAFGVFLIYVTFQQTRRGAVYAGLGARHSRRALAHMKETSRVELRPWMLYKSVTLLPFDNDAADGKPAHSGVILSVFFQNYGKTPAVKIGNGNGKALKPYNEPAPTFPDFRPPQGTGTCAPGKDTELFDVTLTDTQFSQIARREVALWLHFRIEYCSLISPEDVHHTQMTLRVEYFGEMIDEDGRSWPQVRTINAGSKNSIG